jgi:hypothetical protein
MPSGILGQIVPVSGTNTTVYTIPSGKLSTFNVNIVNRNSSVITASLALASTSTPTNAEWIEFNTTIPANGVLERTGFVVQAGENVVVSVSADNVSVNVYGYEE